MTITRLPVVGKNRKALWYLQADGNSEISYLSRKHTTWDYCFPDDGENEIDVSQILNRLYDAML